MERAVAWKPPYSEEKREKTHLGLKKTRLGGPKEGLALAKTRLGCQKIPCVSRQNLSQDGGTPISIRSRCSAHAQFFPVPKVLSRIFVVATEI